MLPEGIQRILRILAIQGAGLILLAQVAIVTTSAEYSTLIVATVCAQFGVLVCPQVTYAYLSKGLRINVTEALRIYIRGSWIIVPTVAIAVISISAQTALATSSYSTIIASIAFAISSGCYNEAVMTMRGVENVAKYTAYSMLPILLQIAGIEILRTLEMIGVSNVLTVQASSFLACALLYNWQMTSNPKYIVASAKSEHLSVFQIYRSTAVASFAMALAGFINSSIPRFALIEIYTEASAKAPLIGFTLASKVHTLIDALGEKAFRYDISGKAMYTALYGLVTLCSVLLLALVLLSLLNTNYEYKGVPVDDLIGAAVLFIPYFMLIGLSSPLHHQLARKSGLAELIIPSLIPAGSLALIYVATDWEVSSYLAAIMCTLAAFQLALFLRAVYR